MTTLQFADTHNLVAFLAKPAECEGFKQIVDFLNAHPIKYALTVNPTIYTSCIEQFWATVKAKTVNGEVQLQALVDGMKIIITESIVRRDLQLEDGEGVDCLSNATIFEQLTLMGAKTTAWNEFSSIMASAIICLAINQKFNFSKYIFKSMVKNLENVSDEAINEEMDDSLVRATTTASSLEAKQDSGNINKTQSKATLNEPSSSGTSSGSGPSLKKRVKKLERRKKSRTRGLKRLYKIGSSRRVESSEEEDMFGVHDLDGDMVVVESKARASKKRNVEEVVDVIDTASTILVSVATTITTTTIITDDEITLAKALAELKSAKPPTQAASTRPKKYKLFLQLLEARKKYFAAIRAQEKINKPLTKAQKRKTMSTYLKHMTRYRHNQLNNKSFDDIQKLFDKAMKRVNTFVDMDKKLVEGSKQKVDDDKETAELKNLMEVMPDEEEVALDAIPLAVKSPSIVDWKIHKEGKKSYY
ncbi:hypothetical protein Tco_1293919 [Tanacetum coccineum]